MFESFYDAYGIHTRRQKLYLASADQWHKVARPRQLFVGTTARDMPEFDKRQ